ncbi:MULTISPECIES: hypothetical protein [Rheinheimera]|jgi:hypothetical protein|uniref:hypothetical protein n=1 Tax=Rheinheimera TaxID=67575 RepID=UPI001E45999A|nr:MULTISPECIES: hypothetical protein [Rheinheimera]HJS15342.1 hypothetical protein [Rheinheimera sp.]
MKTQSSLFKLALAVMLATSVAACSESDAEKAEDKMEELKVQVEDKAEQAGEKLEEAADKTADAMEDAADQTAAKAKELCEAAKEKADAKDTDC